MVGLMRGEDGLLRCGWAAEPDLYRRYHDEEWGRPVHADDAIFERLTLEAFQSGLSWLTILRKREAFRAAFAGFLIERVAAYQDREVDRLMSDAGIIRNRTKVLAAISNARAAAALLERDGHGALDRLLWAHRPANERPPTAPVPATTPESVALAQALKRAGFVFVGPKTAYAAMQAMGLVDDHLEGCTSRGAGPLRRRPPLPFTDNRTQ